MTTLRLTRPEGARPTSIAALTDALTRHLHTRVHPRMVMHDEDGMTVTCDVTAPADLVRIACAAVVHEPVRAVVTSDEDAARDRKAAAR